MFSIASVLFPCLSTSDQVALCLTMRGIRTNDLFYKMVPSFPIRKMALNVDQFMNLPDETCATLTHLILGCLQAGFTEKLLKMTNLVYIEIYYSAASLLYLRIPPKVETCICNGASGGMLINTDECENLKVLELCNLTCAEFQMPPHLISLRLPLVQEKIQAFPESLERLAFDSPYNFPVDALPSGLTTWDCGDTWNHPSITSLTRDAGNVGFIS